MFKYFFISIVLVAIGNVGLFLEKRKHEKPRKVNCFELYGNYGLNNDTKVILKCMFDEETCYINMKSDATSCIKVEGKR